MNGQNSSIYWNKWKDHSLAILLRLALSPICDQNSAEWGGGEQIVITEWEWGRKLSGESLVNGQRHQVVINHMWPDLDNGHPLLPQINMFLIRKWAKWVAKSQDTQQPLWKVSGWLKLLSWGQDVPSVWSFHKKSYILSLKIIFSWCSILCDHAIIMNDLKINMDMVTLW